MILSAHPESGLFAWIAFSVANILFLREVVLIIRVKRDKPTICAFFGQEDLPESIRDYLSRLLSPFYCPFVWRLTTFLPVIRRLVWRYAERQLELLALSPPILPLLVRYTNLPLARLRPSPPCLHALDRRRDPSSMALGPFRSLSSRLLPH
jgi:hypothetical protein